MNYVVIKSSDVVMDIYTPISCVLQEDNWDDWFTYSTMYDLYFFDQSRHRIYLGKVKIGQVGMIEGQRRPELPLQFSALSNDFFSLGQESRYYENIKSLGEVIRDELLNSLNDIAFNLSILKLSLKESVTKISLLRHLNQEVIRGQFHRIAHGGVELTEYHFEYIAPNDEFTPSPMVLRFDVIPESMPPTNIHVLIGRNGVGKTHHINNMLRAILTKDNNFGIVQFIGASSKFEEQFTKIMLVAFSAFDESKIMSKSKKFKKIGLTVSTETNLESPSQQKFVVDFTRSFKSCVLGVKQGLLQKALGTLSNDPLFMEADLLSICSRETFDESKLQDTFTKLSSGHKIILLSITNIVDEVEEKTLVFLDEPEGHLHPPLLSAYIRALSDLLIEKNGIAIIATHSPVILQEVPSSCVWKLNRAGLACKGERLGVESFGQDIATLTSDVFGLELTHSGYHELLYQLTKSGASYETIIEQMKGQLGFEGRAVLKAIVVDRDKGQ